MSAWSWPSSGSAGHEADRGGSDAKSGKGYGESEASQCANHSWTGSGNQSQGSGWQSYQSWGTQSHGGSSNSNFGDKQPMEGKGREKAARYVPPEPTKKPKKLPSAKQKGTKSLTYLTCSRPDKIKMLRGLGFGLFQINTLSNVEMTRVICFLLQRNAHDRCDSLVDEDDRSRLDRGGWVHPHLKVL